ncbi:dihydrofolate reductase [Nocardiaceae bacterium YC2-7]|uniref:Dihydrofolate reductase n=1 Tax=Antrihabitans stalactiti TaxID=2584121 RepID=A0A848KAM1_9NOCA|nr:dihydrofolate reductase family protein [Antrihabitans stalactiti]NMN95401.1 dihydrofolate reductase [Antrihabitans stalactiti]
MRTLIVTENVTLDGFISPIGDWFAPSGDDEELLATTTAHGEAADALVLGRTTYDEFASYWPHQVDDETGITEYLDQVDKYVVSTTLDRADWVNTTIVDGPVVAELGALKERSGKDIVITGSVTLVHSLLPTGLVDVVRLFVFPVVQGHGRRLFPDDVALDAELMETKSFESGVVLLSYRLPRVERD